MKKRHQIYGGREADEYRPSSQLYEEALRDQEIAEGEEVAELAKRTKAFFDNPNPTNRKAIDDYVIELKSQGHSQNRIDSMLIRATANQTVKDPNRITRTPSARCLRRRAKKDSL